MIMPHEEQHAIDIMKPPLSIADLLVVYLQDAIDIKVKHGVIGLLKHISQTPANRPVLGHGRILEALRTSQVFSERSDISEVVQMSAINLTKHMCTNNSMRISVSSAVIRLRGCFLYS